VKPGSLLAQALERGTEHLDGILYADHLESSEKAFEAIREEED
jgi:peptide deformylase